jgi:hypothetical protein
MFKQTIKYILTLICLLVGSTFTQAQAEIQLSRLLIQLWPEFDRPETLVIYQGQLADSVGLPATLTFQLPARIETMHAVAVFNEQGNLITTPYEIERVGDTLRLTFTVTRPAFQFEYYDPAIVVKDGSKRSLNYRAIADYTVSEFQIKVQQPFGAEAMELLPLPDETTVGLDQLIYYVFEQRNLPSGEVVSIIGGYTKEDDTVTTKVQIGIPQPSRPTTISTSDQNWLLLGYVLVGLGASILIAVVVWWYFNRRRLQAATRRPSPKRGAARSARSTPAQPQTQPTQTEFESKFCHKCGAPFKEDALFCHKCGAARR